MFSLWSQDLHGDLELRKTEESPLDEEYKEKRTQVCGFKQGSFNPTHAVIKKTWSQKHNIPLKT